MKNFSLYASAALGLFVAFGHSAQAQTIISVNFTGVSNSTDGDPSYLSPEQVAGVVQAANFNNADGNGGGSAIPTGQIQNVTDNTGNGISGLSITYGAPAEGTNGGKSTNAAPAPPNQELLDGFIASSGTTVATTTISALPANFGTYDLYVYLADAANMTPGTSTGTYTYEAGLVDTSGVFFGDATTISTKTVMAATTITDPFTPATTTKAGNYIEFTGLTAPTFQLSANSTTGEAPINGFQIVSDASAAPEPSQVAALGVTALGLAGLIFRAKRRKASAV